MHTTRVGILDGYRFLAILVVMLFHFFTRYAPPFLEIAVYPYGNNYSFFELGRLGVNFFFIISGFVIIYTLETTAHFSDFWKKRLIRLLPSLIIASILTYAIANLFQSKFNFSESSELKNFFISLSLLPPHLFDKVLPTLAPFHYINGSYWSLWPEIQFYLFASTIYYLSKKHFLRNFVVISFITIGINSLVEKVITGNTVHTHLLSTLLSNYNFWIKKTFNLFFYLPFFCLGVFFYILFKRKGTAPVSMPFKISFTLLICYILHAGVGIEVKVAYASMLLLFFGFLYYPEKLVFFESAFIRRIGISSYFLYLIHEHIGVFMISLLGAYFMPLGFMLPLLLIVCFIGISIIFTEKIDNKLNKYIKSKVLPSNRPGRALKKPALFKKIFVYDTQKHDLNLK